MFLRSVKEINRSISKGIKNVHLNSRYLEKLTFSKLPFSKFEKFISRSVFRVRRFTQILLHFKTSCRPFKTKGIMTFYSQSLKTKRDRKWKIPYMFLERYTLCFNSYKIANWKCSNLWKKKRVHFLNVYFVLINVLWRN